MPKYKAKPNDLSTLGNINLNFENVTLDSLNKILKSKGRQKEKPELNTRVLFWFAGAIEAKFIEDEAIN